MTRTLKSAGKLMNSVLINCATPVMNADAPDAVASNCGLNFPGDLACVPSALKSRGKCGMDEGGTH